MTLMTSPPAPGRRGPDPMTKIAIVCVVAFGLILLFARLVHADATPVPAPVPVAIDWQIWIALGIAALAGVRAIVDTLLAFFKAEAPLTKTTVDDSIRGGLQRVHDRLEKLESIERVVQGIAQQTVPKEASAPPAPAATPGSGTAAMLAVLLLGGLAGSTLTSCATAPAAIVGGTTAFVACEDGHLNAKDLADAEAMAGAELRHLLSGGPAVDTAALKADLAPLKSDLARCGWAAAIAAIGALLPTSTPGTAVSALSSSSPAPAAVRAQFSSAARAAGWPPMQLAGGDVM